MYPSICGEFNIAPNTQIGKVIIKHKVYEDENAYSSPKYLRGGEFIENFVTDNHIEFCKRWLHLAGVIEFLADMKEYVEKCVTYGCSLNRFQNINGKIVQSPIYDVDGEDTRRDRKVINPIILFDSLKDNGISTDFEEIKENGIKRSNN